MSYPLRLPENLDLKARERAAAIGISFNAFICVCVDAYLHGAGRAAPVGSVRASVDRPGAKPESEPLDPGWQYFHPDPETWPYVDPDFEAERLGFDDGDDAAMAALEAKYWSMRQRPGADSPALGPAVGTPAVPVAPVRKNLTKAQRRALAQRQRR